MSRAREEIVKRLSYKVEASLDSLNENMDNLLEKVGIPEDERFAYVKEAAGVDFAENYQDWVDGI